MSLPTASFLVELGTEELPPKSLLTLSNCFAESIAQELDVLSLGYSEIKPYASPRRLAVKIDGLDIKQKDFTEEKLGPPVKAAFDQAGNPTKVAEGFARSNHLTVGDLEQKETDKGLRLAALVNHIGQQSETLMPVIIEKALSALPIPKRMRWGNKRIEFIRPVHWLLMLMDDKVVPATILNLTSDRITFGHRFHHPEKININHADDYVSTLENSAFVLVDFEKRKQKILKDVQAAAKAKKGNASIDPDLLNEVTALVEWPVALAGNFESSFLDVPAEALISSMQEHQKYFPVLDDNGDLLPHFITVSNIESKDSELIISGNERVIRPRLSDAAFFFNTDKKETLASRRDALKKVVFQKNLGTLFDKTERIKILSSYLSEETSLSAIADVSRASELCKADLTTNMVLEFSDLQGIAGTYYARHDGEAVEVANAIKEHYLPKFSGDALPESGTGTLLAIADRVDTLVGIFGINQIPTGSKDPFALRRASLSVLRLMIQNKLSIDLKPLIEKSISLYSDVNLENKNVASDSLRYVMDRLRAWYEEQNISTDVYLSVAAKNISSPLNFDQRIQATSAFSKLDAAGSLAAANKRVSNLLSKAENVSSKINESLFKEKAEHALFDAVQIAQKETAPLIKNQDYEQTLVCLAKLQAPVDDFFADVMVMSEDESIRDNRLALLQKLRNMFLDVADISLLSAK